MIKSLMHSRASRPQRSRKLKQALKTQRRNARAGTLSQSAATRSFKKQKKSRRRSRRRKRRTPLPETPRMEKHPSRERKRHESLPPPSPYLFFQIPKTRALQGNRCTSGQLLSLSLPSTCPRDESVSSFGPRDLRSQRDSSLSLSRR